MMTTHTNLRAGTAPGTAAAPTLPQPAASAAGGGDFLAMLAATLAVEVATAGGQAEAESREPSTDTPPADESQSGGLDALMAMLCPALPVAAAVVAAEAASDHPEGDAATFGSAAPAALTRADASTPEKLNSLLHEVLDAQTEADASGQASTGDAPAQDAPDQLLQMFSSLPRESDSGFRLPVGTDGMAALTGSAAGSTPQGVSASNSPSVGEQALLRSAVGSPRWAEELGSRLMLMSVRGQHEGSLTLSPEHLGPLEVRISVQQNTAQVWFGAQHVDTRQALAEALPRLREMFAEAGLSLGQAGVSQEAPRRGPIDTIAPDASMRADDPSIADERVDVHVRSVSNSLLDLYA
jgi:flagellar hook-length control protein FliK